MNTTQRQRKIIFLTNNQKFISGKQLNTKVFIALTNGTSIHSRFTCMARKAYLNSNVFNFKIAEENLFIRGDVSQKIVRFNDETEAFMADILNGDVDANIRSKKYSIYDVNDSELECFISRFVPIKEAIDEMESTTVHEEDSNIYDRFVNLEFNSANTKELQEKVFFNEVEISDELINLLNDYDTKASEKDIYAKSLEDAELSKLEISESISETEAEIEKLKLKISDFNNQIAVIDESIISMNTSIENLSKELTTSENIINSYIEASKIRKKEKEAEEFYNNLDENQKHHFKCMIGEEFIANYIKRKFGADSIEEYINSRLSMQPTNSVSPSVNILNVNTTADEDAAFVEKARNHIIAVAQKRELPNKDLIKAVVDRLNKSNLKSITYTYISEELGLSHHYTLKFCEMVEKGKFGLRRPNRRHYPTKKKMNSAAAKRSAETRKKNIAAKAEMINKTLKGGVM